MDREIKSHPSYGMISFSRINGGGERFYGSEMIPDNYIEMRVMTSEMETDLSSTRYYGKDRILSVRMTSVQFSELITSMNVGDGVPCTIDRIMGEKVERIPTHEQRPDFVLRKFNDRLKEMGESVSRNLNSVDHILKKPKLSKDDKEEIKKILSKHEVEITKNIPFFLRCFQESMDEIVVDAKTTIDSALLHKITTLGLSELHKQNKLLTNESDQES